MTTPPMRPDFTQPPPPLPGSYAPQSVAQAVAEPALPAAKPKKKHRLLRIAVPVVALGAIFGGCSAALSDGSGKAADTRRQVAAYDACKSAVSDQLKAPRSADFQSIFSADISTNGPSFVIKAYVDAQNSFGAKMRNDWLCSADVDQQGNASSVRVEGVVPRG